MVTLHCPVCGVVTGTVDDVPENVDRDNYCSQHHPDPEHRRVDKPTVRMTVAIADPETDPGNT